MGWTLLPFPLLVVLVVLLGGAALLLARQTSDGSAHARADEPFAPPTSAGSSRVRLGAVLEVVAIVGGVLALVVGAQAYVVRPFRIPSTSMAPTLQVGQQVLVDRLTLRFEAPDRGDIVVFHPPTGAANSRCGVRRRAGEACRRPIGGELDILFIKRVVAVPGDQLQIVRGRVYINGRLQREPSIRAAATCDACNLALPITIAPREFFVMGDNRANSVDSRYWGPIPRDSIIGRAIFTYWPPRRFGSL